LKNIDNIKFEDNIKINEYEKIKEYNRRRGDVYYSKYKIKHIT
jgi:hypothetical protein